MSRARLYIHPPLVGSTRVELDADQAHYLGRVLRMRAGDLLTVFDGRGREFPATVDEFHRNRASLELGEPVERIRESPLHTRLVQGISRGERMDYSVQKATELGVTEIQPVLTEHTVVKLAKDRAIRRVRHWQRIAASACEQCGRNVLPRIRDPLRLDAFLESESDASLRITLSPGGKTGIASCGYTGSGSIDLLVGPEGGLDEREHAAAEQAGFTPCSMGPRILRSETAGMTALAIIQSLWGDLGRQD